MILTDEPTPCYGQSFITDEVIERSARYYEAALTQHQRMCNACPIRETCHEMYADEDWVLAVQGRKRPPSPNTSNRAARLKELADAGATLHQAVAELDTTITVLWNWAKANDQLHVYKRLTKSAPAPVKPRTTPKFQVRRASLRRIEDMQSLLDNGGTITDACRAFDITRDGLLKWCKSQGLVDLFNELAGRRDAA